MAGARAADEDVLDVTSSSPTECWQPLLADVQPWKPPARRTVVVVPHPDDEVLSTGGLIQRQLRRGLEVLVLAVTDGEAAYPGVADLAAIRRGEQVAALAALGVAADHIVRLGLPDGAVALHEERLAKRITSAIAAGDLVVAPWTGDHHTDHEACGRAASSAAHRVGAALVQGLFWTWHHARPEDVAGPALRRLPLTEEEQATRARALACHRSQVTGWLHDPPMLDEVDLEPATWDSEYVLDRTGLT